jgi:hypothetical protein
MRRRHRDGGHAQPRAIVAIAAARSKYALLTSNEHRIQRRRRPIIWYHKCTVAVVGMFHYISCKAAYDAVSLESEARREELQRSRFYSELRSSLYF